MMMYASIIGIVQLHKTKYFQSHVIHIYFSSPLCQVNILYKENYFHIIKEPFSQGNLHNLTPNMNTLFPVLTTTLVL